MYIKKLPTGTGVCHMGLSPSFTPNPSPLLACAMGVAGGCSGTWVPNEGVTDGALGSNSGLVQPQLMQASGEPASAWQSLSFRIPNKLILKKLSGSLNNHYSFTSQFLWRKTVSHLLVVPQIQIFNAWKSGVRVGQRLLGSTKSPS